MTNKTVTIASDHRGYPLKQLVIGWLTENGYSVNDLGPAGEAERVNASDYAVRVASAMRVDPMSRGILICGTGQVMAMTANRFKHIRAALCTNSTMARLARQHNDANVLVLGAHVIGEEVAKECLDVFMTTETLGGRYAERCQLLTELGGL
ncbi:MAG: ribose 5-phosphate isomerase B [Alphaproteobacteria bacterium]|nr:ribose 5-phosphate isomerase B [Alphaproteobacteria bacterium]